MSWFWDGEEENGVPVARVLCENSLDLAEVERDVGWHVFSAGDFDGSDCGCRSSVHGGITGDRSKEGLPVPVVGGELVGVQVLGDELVHGEDGDLRVAALGLDEGCCRCVEELIAERSASTIRLFAEESARESCDSGRHIGPRVGAATVVVFADKAIAERFVRLAFNGDQKFTGAECSEDNEVGIPVLAPEVVKRNNELGVGFAQNDASEWK